MPSLILSRLASFALVPWMGACAQSASFAAPHIQTCDSITLARPGVGVAYKGTVRNDDYGVKIDIPGGLTGWGGVAPEAPFHGFVIFLPDSPRSCIGFRIQLRVDLGDGALPERHHAGKAAAVGNRRGWEDDRSGVVNGTALTNVTITFSVPHRREIYDGSVWLVTPTEELEKEMPTFRKFVSGIRFDAEEGH